MRVPNPAQAHASIATTTTASTLATLGYSAHNSSEEFLLQAVGGDVRYTINGTDPTTTLGFKLEDGDYLGLGDVEIGTLKVITGSGTPKLEIGAYINS